MTIDNETPIERMRRKDKERTQIWREIQQNAIKTGYYLVQVSSRRYDVLKFYAISIHLDIAVPQLTRECQNVTWEQAIRFFEDNGLKVNPGDLL